MIITTPRGNTIVGTIRNVCVGMVARRIELEPRDIRAMIDMVNNGQNTDLHAILVQLLSRFESERARF